MGVGNYIQSKEVPSIQLHSAAAEKSNQRLSRQALAEQARVGVPATRLAAPLSFGVVQGPPQSLQNEGATHRSAFDTDAEGVDDSTVGGTSIVEENSHVNAPVYSNTHQRTQSWNEIQVYDIDIPEGLGDKAMKAAGFELDDADVVDTEARSSVSINDGDEDDEADDEDTQTINWAISRDLPRSSEATMSGRLENHLRTTSKTPRMSPIPTTGDTIGSSSRFVSASNGAKTGVVSYSNVIKMNPLPQSLGNTPRNRFNFKSSRPYERLVQLSPTRRASGPRPQPARPEFTSIPQRRDGQKQGNFTVGQQERYLNEQIYDLTDDESYKDLNRRDPRSNNAAPVTTTPTSPKKRRFISDYSQEALETKSFHDLEEESFDYIPATVDSQVTVPPSQSGGAETAAEKVSHLLSLRDEDRPAYLSNLSLTEWDECGDQLIAELGSLLVKIKEARQARRRTAVVFEAEIKRRHEQAQTCDAELGKKLAEMKEGGMGVLKGLGP